MKKQKMKLPEEYHDTELLLKNYRKIEIALSRKVERTKKKIQDECGKPLDEYLNSPSSQRVSFDRTSINSDLSQISEINNLLKRVRNVAEWMKNSGDRKLEEEYWVLYYTYFDNTKNSPEEIITKLSIEFGKPIAQNTYYVLRRKAIAEMESKMFLFFSRKILSIFYDFCEREVNINSEY